MADDTLPDAGSALTAADVLRALMVADAAASLERLKAVYEREPMGGLAECFRWGLSVPQWLADAYLRCHSLAIDGAGWDGAFGKLPSARSVQTLETALDAVGAACQVFAENPGHAIDKVFWEQVGELIGLGETQAEQRYRQAQSLGLAPSPTDLRASMKSDEDQPGEP